MQRHSDPVIAPTLVLNAQYTGSENTDTTSENSGSDGDSDSESEHDPSLSSSVQQRVRRDFEYHLQDFPEFMVSFKYVLNPIIPHH